MKLPIAVIKALSAKSGLRLDAEIHDKDIALLMEDICRVTGRHLGLNTLKRALCVGKVGNHAPRVSTLDVLANYLGHDNWMSLIDALEERISTFGKLDGEIFSSDLSEGNIVELTFINDRRLSLRFDGDRQYTVISSQNSKLQEGDICFICTFVQGMALVITNVIRGGEDLGRYMAGIIGGIVSIKVIDAQ